ncbi:MAG: twin-arginine translocase subunit TatC [Prevotellaceae bacterium]|jgi:sec-independent protein translocase protein TatC|nr:twin-arginine translocase subunit TatC [Prevotellaceae bacterium]
MESPAHEATFWEHLDELRKMIFRSLAVVAVFAVVAFVCKDWLFDVIFAPSKSDFLTFRLLCVAGKKLSLDLCLAPLETHLISTQLSAQFMIHLSMSFYFGLIAAFPYIVYQLFRFISPALYKKEKKYSAQVIISSGLLFLFGVLLNYFIIFPLSFRFLATYQVEETVVNMFSISSYINTFTMLSLMLGLMTELPIIAWILGKLGLISAELMKKFRRHVAIAIMILAAVITPTADIFTLLLVFTPIYLLYEASILIVRKK